LLNIKKNRPKLVRMCGYTLTTSFQNFIEIYLAQVKILQKVLGGWGLLFLTHTVDKQKGLARPARLNKNIAHVILIDLQGVSKRVPIEFL